MAANAGASLFGAASPQENELAAEKKAKPQDTKPQNNRNPPPAKRPAPAPSRSTGSAAPEGSGNNDNRLERIRERAFAIWLNEGQPHGRDREHWQEAERQIDGE